ncbi:MAG: hypothetical protein IH960_09975 [Chloroflexi bacterium]|nr:hypothetical protein [Chloroflexota bacterium]
MSEPDHVEHGGGPSVSGVPEISKSYGSAEETQPSVHLQAIWNELMSLKHLVENDHDHKLRRIETDLRWTMMLVGAQFITIIGSAIATLVGG